jgi:uncharacterized protein YegP (UPF0339 family)
MRIASSLLTVLALSLVTASATGCATGADEVLAQEDGVAGEGTAGKLTLWQSSDGEHRFHLAAAGGQVLLSSEGYASRIGAINGFLSVLENGVDAARYEIVPADGGYLLLLVAANRQTIAFSGVHATEASASRAIASSVSAITGYLDRREAATTDARVEVLATATGEHRFHVHAKDGAILLSSETYVTEAAAYNGALAVQQAGRARASYSIRQTAAGASYFVLQAANGEIVGTSPRYATREAADGAIASLIVLLPTLAVL